MLEKGFHTTIREDVKKIKALTDENRLAILLALKVELSPEGVVTVTDELTGLKPGVKVVWGFTTQQKVEAYDDKSVTLVNGEKRFVTETLNGGEVRVVDVTVPQPEFKGNSMNKNARRVEVVATASEDGKALLRVKMGLK